MRRRDFVKWSLGAVSMGIIPWEQALAAPTGVIQGGWIDDPVARQLWVKSQALPFLTQQNQAIRESGKGEIALLYKYFEEVTKSPLIPHRQDCGDCFRAGTLVTMADGSRKAIEQIKVGEEILSHTGMARKVTRTIRKPYAKSLVRFKGTGCIEDVVCTPDHLLWVNEGEWKAAGNLSLNDRVYIQRYHGAIKATQWDLLDICPDAEVDGDKLRAKGSQKWVNRFIYLDEKLAYVIGAYLAEGGCSQSSSTKWAPGQWCKVDFNLGQTEQAFADAISNRMAAIFGIECQVYSVPSKPTVKYVRCQNKAVARFFKRIMPGNTYTKEVPTELLVASRELQLACLMGYLEGDGSCPGRKQRKKAAKNRSARCSGVSVSKKMILGLSRLANNCGFTPKATPAKIREGRAPAYILQFSAADTALLYPGITHRVYPGSKIGPYGVSRKVESVSRISKAKTTVYCIEIEHEDHSFIANGYSVHNCIGQGFGLGVDILSTVQMLMHGKPERWIAKAATEVIYGGSRVEVGGGRLRWGDGSLGIWAAEFVKDWGILQRKRYMGGRYDFTEYSGTKAREMGRSGVPDELEPLCKLHPVKTVSICRTWEECRDAIANGYPVAMCSNVGFRTRGGRDKDGFLSPGRRPWNHCMLIAGIDDSYKRPGGLLINSWGSNWTYGPKRHGQPEGSFWADASVINRAMRQGDSFALSGYLGYPKIDLDYRFW